MSGAGGALGTRGSLFLPMAAWLVLVASAALGLIAIMGGWRATAHLQRSLDRCVGVAALDLRDALNTLERTNRAMEATRVAIAAASALAPPARAALTAQLMGLMVYQEALLTRWRWVQNAWVLTRRCGITPSPWNRFPSSPWRRNPPDDLGPQPLYWAGGGERVFFIKKARLSRAAAAELRCENGFIPRWSAQWTDPSRARRAVERTIVD